MFVPTARAIIQQIEAEGLDIDIGSSVQEVGLSLSAGFPIETHSRYAAFAFAYSHDDEGFRAPYLELCKSRGTQANPTAVTLTGYEQDSIGGINFWGYDGANYVVGAGIYSQISHNWDSNSHGAFLSIYGTSMADGSDPRQLIQFGGRDATDLTTGTGNIDSNIIAYMPIAFGGNKAANACIFYVAAGGAGVQPQIVLKSADESIDVTLVCGQIFWKPGVNGQLTIEATSNTQLTLKLRGTTGNTLYAKPEPLVASPWATDRVVGTENGSTGSYAFSLNSELSYVVYRQAGGSPASFGKNLELDIKTKTDLINSAFTIEARKVVGSDIYAYVGSDKDIGPITVLDAAGAPIDLTGLDLRFCLATRSKETLYEYTPSVSTSTFTVEGIDASIRSQPRSWLWSLRDVDQGNEPVSFGNFYVIYAAKRL